MRAKGQLHAKRKLSQSPVLSDVQARGHAALKFNETGAATAGNLFTFSTQLARGASHILALALSRGKQLTGCSSIFLASCGGKCGHYLHNSRSLVWRGGRAP
jgi:hypothetical protein